MKLTVVPQEQRLIEIGNRIKLLRRCHKMSQEDLAELIDCSRAKVARVENGESLLSILELELVAKRFDTTIMDLLGYKRSVTTSINWEVPR